MFAPQMLQALEERKDGSQKMEGQVSSIWDQIRHVENSLSQRLGLAETSQVATLQVSCQQSRWAQLWIMDGKWVGLANTVYIQVINMVALHYHTQYIRGIYMVLANPKSGCIG